MRIVRANLRALFSALALQHPIGAALAHSAPAVDSSARIDNHLHEPIAAATTPHRFAKPTRIT